MAVFVNQPQFLSTDADLPAEADYPDGRGLPFMEFATDRHHNAVGRDLCAQWEHDLEAQLRRMEKCWAVHGRWPALALLCNLDYNRNWEGPVGRVNKVNARAGPARLLASGENHRDWGATLSCEQTESWRSRWQSYWFLLPAPSEVEALCEVATHARFGPLLLAYTVALVIVVVLGEIVSCVRDFCRARRKPARSECWPEAARPMDEEQAQAILAQILGPNWHFLGDLHGDQEADRA